MSDIGDHKHYPMIPPNELRCVWMTAGILSYQLCDRELDCEHCPLHGALRTRFVEKVPASGPGAEQSARPLTKRSLHSDYRYSRKHTWVRLGDQTQVRIGISPPLASALMSPKAVVLPSLGERVQRNRVCAWIVIEGGTLPILAPVDGEVKSTNANLLQNPHAVCDAPLDEGWLFDLSTDRESVDRAELHGVAEAAKIFSEDESRFQSLITAELTKAGSEVGATLPDGGQLLQNVVSMLGATKYFRLVREVFG